LVKKSDSPRRGGSGSKRRESTDRERIKPKTMTATRLQKFTKG